MKFGIVKLARSQPAAVASSAGKTSNTSNSAIMIRDFAAFEKCERPPLLKAAVASDRPQPSDFSRTTWIRKSRRGNGARDGLERLAQIRADELHCGDNHHRDAGRDQAVFN